MKGLINKILSKFNYKIQRISHPSKAADKSSCLNKIMLNLGSGNWSCDGWTNLDYPSEWYEKEQKNHVIVPYDIRKDNIPYADNSVDIIYCSHVIEHIEEENVKKMFEECFRVLKKGGILRIACPDAEFIYLVSKFKNDYWRWRTPWFSSDSFYKQGNIPKPIDFLIREIATPKLSNYVNSITTKNYSKEYEEMSMDDFFIFLTRDLKFRENFVGDHINYWTFEKIRNIFSNLGFQHIIRSKRGGSIANEMQDPLFFDTTQPHMSLYVEAVK